MKYDKRKKAKVTLPDGRDFWGAKKLSTYGDKAAISDSYHLGCSKALRDRLRRQVKKAARQVPIEVEV
jgi:hypothetical protein